MRPNHNYRNNQTSLQSNLLTCKNQYNSIDIRSQSSPSQDLKNELRSLNTDHNKFHSRQFRNASQNYNKTYIKKNNIEFQFGTIKHDQSNSLHLLQDEPTNISHYSTKQGFIQCDKLQAKVINIQLQIRNNYSKQQKRFYRIIKQDHGKHMKTQSHRNSAYQIQNSNSNSRQELFLSNDRPITNMLKKNQKQFRRKLRNNGLTINQQQKRYTPFNNQIKNTLKSQKIRLLENRRIVIPTKKSIQKQAFQYNLLAITKLVEPCKQKNSMMQNKQKQLQKSGKTNMEQILSKTFNQQKNEYITKRKINNKKDYFIFGLDTRVTYENKIQIYRDFLWKINFSNGLFVQTPVQNQKGFHIYIGSGNNSLLIKGLMRRRFWWIFDQKITDQTNFVWTQLKQSNYFKYQKQQYPSSFKFIKSQIKGECRSRSQTNQCLTQVSFCQNSQKKIQIKTQSAILLSKNQNLHGAIFSNQDLYQWNKYYQKHRKLQDQLNQKVYIKRSTLLKKKNAKKIQKSQILKVHNHFDCNYFIGNKKAMFYNLRKYYELKRKNVFDYLPMTFHITKSVQDIQFKKFLTHYNKIQDIKKINKNIKNIWIVKPGEFTNRGKGITVCSSLDDIIIRLKGRERNANGTYRTFIVQKYIQKPLLYFKRKFDIRHYMMITCINGYYKGYWYAQGYIRTTSYEFSLKNCKDNFIHLTNDAIQKNGQQYGRYERGNKVSYPEFQKYLDTNQKQHKIKFDNILKKMQQIATDSIKSTYHLLDPNRKSHNFQIFGMDFMIDSQFHPWLIQINTNPCLQLACPLLSKLIPNMLQNAFKLTIDPLFQPPLDWPNNKKYQLGENPLQTNRFKLIFDEMSQGQQIQQLYKNVQRIDRNMGYIEEQEEQYVDEGKQWNQDI